MAAEEASHKELEDAATTATISTVDDTVDATLSRLKLKQELQEIKERLHSQAPEELNDMMMEILREFASSEVLDFALQKGDRLPDFSLVDQTGNAVSSVDLRLQGPLVVTFFRGGWCPMCSASLRMISRYKSQFKARGATVVAISPQTLDATKNTAEKLDLNIYLLSDEGSEYAQACNIAYELDEELRTYMPFIAESQGNDDWILPIPATYVVDTNGIITYSFVETDYTVRAEPSNILELLPPLQTDQFLKTLRDELEYEWSLLRDQYPELVRNVEMEILALGDMHESALQVGQVAPEFKLKDQHGKVIESKKLLRKRPLILLFYIGPWSSLCRITLQAYQKHLHEFEGKGAKVIAISPTSASGEFQDISFPLLHDEGSKIAKQFRLQYHMDTDLPGKPNTPWPLPMCSAYILGEKSGEILYSQVNCDLTRRPEPTQVLKELPAPKHLQYERKRGPFSLKMRGWLPVKKKNSEVEDE